MAQIYNIRIQSAFLLTQAELRSRFGNGFKLLEVEVEKDVRSTRIVDTDSAMEQIVLAGYRALARAHHPDLGGDPEIMVTLNRTKRELLDLLKELK